MTLKKKYFINSAQKSGATCLSRPRISARLRVPKSPRPRVPASPRPRVPRPRPTFSDSPPLALEEMKRVGFFKNAYRNVRKPCFDRRTTQSEFCFETNILCDR